MTGGFPQRDLWLLPLISLLTILLMLTGAEVLARVGWPEQKLNACSVPDAVISFRYLPNCSSMMKSAEGPWYSNDYNACGYRSTAPCGPVPSGTRRIAIIGASMSEGYLVEYPHTIASRLEADLTAFCGAPVEVQNLAGAGYSGRRLVFRVEEALALQPKAVLLAQSPLDIEQQLGDDTDPITGADPVALPAAVAGLGAGQDGIEPSLQRRVVLWLRESRAFTVAEHFLFQNPSVYVPLFLHYGDKADFMRPPFSAAWRERLRRFDLMMTELTDRAHRAGVPFTLVFVPQEAELSLMDGRPVPPGIDPEAMPNALAAIAKSHGADFIDSSEALRAEPRPNLLYYTVDGHPSGLGQPIIARDIALHYTSAADGPFADCRSIVSKDQAAGASSPPPPLAGRPTQPQAAIAARAPGGIMEATTAR